MARNKCVPYFSLHYVVVDFNIFIWVIGDEAHKAEVPTSKETATNLNTNDTYNLSYTEEEFMKEFNDDGEDDEKNFENDPR